MMNILREYEIIINGKLFGHLQCYRLKRGNLISGCECPDAIPYHKIRRNHSL